MIPHIPSTFRRCALVAGVIATAALISGCVSFGPSTIPRDSFDYQKALSTSLQEQMLLNLVKIRYADAPIFLDVDSVINSYSLEGEISAGRESEESFVRRLFGGAARYGDRPTITYNPVQGERFAKGMLRPLPPRTIMLLVQSGYSVDYVLRLCTRSINGLHNSAFVGRSRKEPDPLFFPVIEALHRIQASQGIVLQLETSAEESAAIVVDIASNNAVRNEDFEFLANSLRLDPEETRFELRYGSQPQSNKELALLTRSLYEVLVEVASMIEAPDQHVKSEITTPNFVGPVNGRAADNLIRIHSSLERPKAPAIAVRARDYWYWVADNDVRSKRLFNLILLLYGLAAVDDDRSPTITIPAR
jgi:hypothetical protein